MSDLQIEMIAGYCPVQAEGTVCGKPCAQEYARNAARAAPAAGSGLEATSMPQGNEAGASGEKTGAAREAGSWLAATISEIHAAVPDEAWEGVPDTSKGDAGEKAP